MGASVEPRLKAGILFGSRQKHIWTRKKETNIYLVRTTYYWTKGISSYRKVSCSQVRGGSCLVKSPLAANCQKLTYLVWVQSNISYLKFCQVECFDPEFERPERSYGKAKERMFRKVEVGNEMPSTILDKYHEFKV